MALNQSTYGPLIFDGNGLCGKFLALKLKADHTLSQSVLSILYLLIGLISDFDFLDADRHQ